MRQIAETLEVARSNLTKKLNKEIGPKVKKVNADQLVLSIINKIVVEQPAYGYLREAALFCFKLILVIVK